MCGVAGAVLAKNRHNLGKYLYAMLYNLQHRGKESAGIFVDKGEGHSQKAEGVGTIDRVFMGVDLDNFGGFAGVAHNRYSTSGLNPGSVSRSEESLMACQPMAGIFQGKTFALSYNGNLVNTEELQDIISEKITNGRHIMPIRPDVDTALIVALIEMSQTCDFKGALQETLPLLSGAFSMTVLYDGKLYVVRDCLGFRPIFICQFRDGIAVASETCAFSSLPEAGEPQMLAQGGMAVISSDRPYGYDVGLWSKNAHRGCFCIFEYIYFARPDGFLGKERVMFIQERLGQKLAMEAPSDADMVIGVPDSGINAARGYAKALELSFRPEAIFRPHTVGRTFIDPVQDLRREGVRFKHFVIEEIVKGKRVVVVDDSIVRGTTVPRVIGLLREAGAKEVHVRISSPPYRNPCYFGIDTWRIKGELIAENFAGDINKICQEIGADSLAYLSLEGAKSVWRGAEGLCDACFSGNYPIFVGK